MGLCCSTRSEGGTRPKVNVKASSQKSLEALNQLSKKTKEMKMFVDKTISLGKPWTDTDFPPERSSLYDPNIDRDIDTRTFNSFKWKRASEIFNPIYIFEDGIEPNDINQGQLGDCYFLAALSSLAEFPDRVK